MEYTHPVLSTLTQPPPSNINLFHEETVHVRPFLIVDFGPQLIFNVICTIFSELNVTLVVMESMKQDG